MAIVQIEHPISSFEAWKTAFDSDPAFREESGVRRYRIVRPIDDPNFVSVDLEFDDVPRAEAFRDALKTLWQTPRAMALFDGGAPRARIVENVESREY